MEKTVDATFDGEVFRPNEPVDLASNTKVKVIIEEKKLKLVEVPKKGKAEPYAFFKYLRTLKLDGPIDFSTNLDDYLYHGKPMNDDE
ncbi:MAG: antitoxin family protein [Acidobacteriota bacterium]|nr:antitoxin family protein [Blastocatellia bacterium]MDQ3490889.1 antitoxin family protein [Acidobacteriota bacterium]